MAIMGILYDYYLFVYIVGLVYGTANDQQYSRF